MNEVNMLKKLVKNALFIYLKDHPNILKIYEFFQTEDDFYIIMEYCNGGELFDRIE